MPVFPTRIVPGKACPSTSTSNLHAAYQSNLTSVRLADGQEHLLHEDDGLVSRNARLLQLLHEAIRIERPVSLPWLGDVHRGSRHRGACVVKHGTVGQEGGQ